MVPNVVSPRTLLIASMVTTAWVANAAASEATFDTHTVEQHHHHAAAFAGATATSENTAFTLGVDYEYRFPFLDDYIGVEVLADFAFFDDLMSIAAGGLTVHPFGGLRLLAATGIEHFAGHTELLFRGGVGYDIYLDYLAVTPTFNLDLVDGHLAYVFGLGFGAGF